MPYPDNFSKKAFEAFWGGGLTEGQQDHAEDYYEDQREETERLESAISALIEAIASSNFKLGFPMAEVFEKEEFLRMLKESLERIEENKKTMYEKAEEKALDENYNY